jgi:hypothetical protein
MIASVGALPSIATRQMSVWNGAIYSTAKPVFFVKRQTRVQPFR